jgi:diguanylate cyclase (GGDEF)-like protein/PAS domain S-box-containing protein
VDDHGEALEQGVLEIAASGLIRAADPGACALLGRRDLVGSPLLEHVHPTDRRVVTAMLTTPAPGGARILRLADRGPGSQVAEVRVVADPARGGATVSLRGLSTFVAPSRTVHTTTRLEKLFLASTDIITVLMPCGEWHASPAGTRILGHPAGYEPEGGLLSLLHPDDVEVAAMALAEVSAGTRAPQDAVRLRVRDASGAFRHFDCTASNLTDDLDVGGIVITARDVSAQQRAEDERADVEARYRATFERSPLGIAMVALDGCLLEANSTLGRLVGHEPAALVGRPIVELVHPADRELLDRLAPGDPTGDPVSRTVRLVHADGHTVWVLADTSTIEHPDGSPAYHVALVADITDRKRLEARLEHQAFHDSLTGLPNRARLTDLLEVAWRNRSAPGHLAVLFVDLDDFKRVNDERDHDAGDELLTLVARRLRAAVRGGDGVCRYGGDEFVVVCAEVEAPEVAVGLAERIRSSIEQPFLLASGPATIGASVGVAFADAHPSPSDLLRAADRAVGRAKASGRNRVVTAGDAP